MKHNTHIYLAAKAIELTRQAVDNTLDDKGKYLTRGKKASERFKATERQRILQHYQDMITEATWSPDDVLHDNDPFHIFKLFTEDEFPGHGITGKDTFKRDDNTYIKFAGGLPYRIDHISQEIISMSKLRNFNDRYDLKQLMYKYLLLSHYVVDAHVPMHCDLRDDPPSKARDDEPSRRKGTDKPVGNYMNKNAHGKLEELWDDAVTPVAIREGIIVQTWDEEKTRNTEYSEKIKFGFEDCKKGGIIKVPIIPDNGLMSHTIDMCIESKRRGRKIFPVENPEERNDSILPDITREIFADSIGNLMGIWRYIWEHHRE